MLNATAWWLLIAAVWGFGGVARYLPSFGQQAAVIQCGVSEIREQCGALCSRQARSRDEAYGVIRRGAATPPDANRAAAMEADF